ncbi:MAG: lipocalin-like domain-containing protein [Bacteroidota bacterium]
MNKVLFTIVLLFFGLVGGVLLLGSEPAPLGASVGIGQAMAGDTTGYVRALGPMPIQFPADHGAHPGYKLEWWYYTGNLQTQEGRRFGYQFTIFRNALAPPDSGEAEDGSAWRTKQLYFAHFALSDIDNQKFYAFERFSRGAAGLAGATPAPFRVWLDDWEATQIGDEMPPMRVRAAEDGVAIDFTMDLVKPIVLQGDAGYSVKGTGYGNASYYYSMTRMDTRGTVAINGTEHAVEGLSWMDREWSTSLLRADQVGWDWFSFHLGDGRDVMYFNVRNTTADVAPYAHGVVVGPTGDKRLLEPDNVTLTVLDTWESKHGGVYPSQWRLQIPAEGLDLEITPFMNDQELDLAVRYWEGAVRVEGTAGGDPIDGSGYVELTGYDRNALQFTDGI